MPRSFIGVPKKPFVYGSPSRNEGHLKDRPFPQKSGANVIKRLGKTAPDGVKSKMSNSLAIPPNSLDFKQLRKSSLADNNLLRFRKIRQTKGTPRDLWTSSPTNQSMSELMAFSFKKEPKEKKRVGSIPTHLTVENSSYWGERDDDLWKKYLKDLENYSYDLHEHNKIVEMTASNREIAHDTYSELSGHEPKESMLEYLMSKMDDENPNVQNSIGQSLNPGKKRETLQPERIPPTTLPTIAQPRHRPTSAPALVIPRSRLNVSKFSPNSSERSVLISPTNMEGRNYYNGHSSSPHSPDANHQNECYDFNDTEPPISTIIHRSTLNKRSRLTLHDRWSDHLLELFEAFETQTKTPNSLKSLYEYKSKENKIVHYVLSKLVDHCSVYELRQRFILIRSSFSNLCLEYMLTLAQAHEQVLINRCQSSECTSTFIDTFYSKHLNKQMLKRAFLSWRHSIYLRRRYIQCTSQYVSKYIKSTTHKRFVALRYLVADAQVSKRQVAQNNKTFSSNRMLKDKILYFDHEIDLRKREKQSGEKELLLLENEIDFAQTEIENSKDNIEEYKTMLKQMQTSYNRQKMESDAKLKRLKSFFQNLQLKKQEKVTTLAVLHRKLMNRQLSNAKKKTKKKRRKVKLQEKSTPMNPLCASTGSRPIPTLVSNMDIWKQMTRSTEFYVVNDSRLNDFVSDYEKTAQLTFMIATSNNEVKFDSAPLMVCNDSPEIAYFKLQALFSKVVTKKIKIKFADKASLKTFSPVDIALRFETLGNFAITIKSKNMVIRPDNGESNFSPHTESKGVLSPFHLIGERKNGKKKTQKQVLAIIFAVKDKYHNATQQWLKSCAISRWIDECRRLDCAGKDKTPSVASIFPLKKHILRYLNSAPVCKLSDKLQSAFPNSEDEGGTNDDSDSMEDEDELVAPEDTAEAFPPQSKVEQNVY